MSVSIIGYKTSAFALHDTNEVAGEPVGFIPDATGTFEGQLKGDSADNTFTVVAGQLYPGQIKFARATDASGVTSLQIWYGTYR